MKHIAIDGIDGSGKSTLVARLESHLRAQGTPVYTNKIKLHATKVLVEIAREKLGEPSPRALFSIPYVEYVFTCDEYLNYQNHIAPLLAGGSKGYVLQDRSKYTRYVNAKMRGVPLDDVMLILDKIPDPDLLFILDIDPAESHRRIVARGNLSLEETLESLTSSAKWYKTIPLLGIPVIFLNATADIETNLLTIINHIKKI